MRLRATIVLEYEAEPENYRIKGESELPSLTASEMVRIDCEEGDLASLMATADSIVISGEEVL